MSDEIYEIKQNLSETVEEAYKVLRTNIQFCEIDKKIKVITITSYTPGEGKTTTSTNLAISMAKSGMNVLLVDADLRKPMVLKQLGRTDFKGLSNYLLNRASFEEIVNDTNIEGFYFITCGVKPINPAELLGAGRFKEFIKAARSQFDLVIIDTPPLGSVIDCAIIAAQADGTIIVMQQKAVKFQHAMHMKEQLAKVNARILGVVLNNVEKSSYREYYGSYDYYGGRRKYIENWLKSVKDKRT